MIRDKATKWGKGDQTNSNPIAGVILATEIPEQNTIAEELKDMTFAYNDVSVIATYRELLEIQKLPDVAWIKLYPQDQARNLLAIWEQMKAENQPLSIDE